MTTQKIEIGDCRELIRKYPDNFFDALVTSPPYFGHRDYKTESLIWDGKVNCVHEWGDDIVQKRSGGTDKSVGNNVDDRIHFENHSSFCTKCGAWHGSLGLEPNFNFYTKHLCDIFDLIKPKIKQTGSIFVNIGDTYWGGNDKSFDYPRKSLCLVPNRFAIEMINRGWILRNENIWWKRNAMPSSATDRFTIDYEKVFFFTKSNEIQYWTNSKTRQLVEKQPNGINGIENVDWEWIQCLKCQVIRKSDANTGTNNKLPYQQNNPHLLRIIGNTKIPIEISEQVESPRARYNRVQEQVLCTRCNGLGKIKSSLWEGHDYYFEPQYEPYTKQLNRWGGNELVSNGKSNWDDGTGQETYRDRNLRPNVLGRMPRTVWDVVTKGFGGQHFATFPVELLKLPILSTCPQYICKKCGKPRERITVSDTMNRTSSNGCGNGELYDGSFGSSVHYQTGWSDCGCGAPFEAGWTLDPFAGSGTVLEFCRLNGRNAIGLELNPDYKPLATDRAMLDQPQIQLGLKNTKVI